MLILAESKVSSQDDLAFGYFMCFHLLLFSVSYSVLSKMKRNMRGQIMMRGSVSYSSVTLHCTLRLAWFDEFETLCTRGLIENYNYVLRLKKAGSMELLDETSQSDDGVSINPISFKLIQSGESKNN